ncbi:hypothetical protein [uncultured Bifidobacterium sp.]|uniref:hypothetical protein n=1 Tax=uncultured Bifidobacterium sp. TaxID=165187 RepID=UPI00261DBE36|nr:hypothetical protein [uncultured Bifidobacterium sp.]
MSARVEGHGQDRGDAPASAVSTTRVTIHSEMCDCAMMRSTRVDATVVSSSSVEVGGGWSAYAANTPGSTSDDSHDSGQRVDVCFDPECSCDGRERAVIEMLRAYLRPQVAPDCLLRRLHETIDHCCHEELDGDE